MIRVEAIIDGGMIGSNPGKGGWGGRFQVLMDDKVLDEAFYGGTFGEEIVTNNICEWRAMNNAVQIFIEKYPDFKDFTIISDSKLVVMQANNKWQCRDKSIIGLKTIFEGLKILTIPYKKLHIIHQRRKYTKVAHDHIAKILGRI